MLVGLHDGGLGCSPFNSITANGSSAPIYDTAHVYSGQTVSMKVITDTGVPCYVEWISAVGSQITLYHRQYFYFTANPGTVLGLVDFRNGSQTCASVSMTATGKLRLNNASGSQIAVSTASISLNQLVRIELDAVAGATGTLTARLYNTADAAEGSPTETITGSNTAGPATFTKCRLGPQTGVAAYTYWTTNLGLSANGQLGPYVAPTGGHTWYVSKNGDNTTGDSWAHAFNEMDPDGSVWNWAAIAPGDTVNIDGGPLPVVPMVRIDPSTWATVRPGLDGRGMVYTNYLTVQNSGTVGNPLVLQKSTEAGHNGTIIQYGGRNLPLPEAAQATYTPTTVGQGWAIDLRGVSYVTLDGKTLSGWMAYGWGDNKSLLVGHGTAVRYDVNSTHIIQRNQEIFDCGQYALGSLTASPTGWAYPLYYCDNNGVEWGGSSNTIDRCLIHDCGQDAIDGQTTSSVMTISNSWLYTSRAHSAWTGYGFQAGCQAVAAQNTVHVDGLQWFGGVADMSGFTASYCIFGPMVNQGLYLGDVGNASWDSVSISNCTCIGCISHGLQGDDAGTGPSNWTIDHCTMHLPSTKYTGYSSQPLAVEVQGGSGSIITNSIATWGAGFYSSSFFTTASCTGNIYNGVGATAIPGGTNVDPAFVLPIGATNISATYDTWAGLDLTPTAVQAIGKGSPLTSVQALINRILSLNSQSLAGRSQVGQRTQANTKTQVSTRSQVSSRVQV